MPDPIANPGDRSRGGGVITEADDLRVGDRLEFHDRHTARSKFFEIVEREDTPKMVRLVIYADLYGQQQVRMRKTTLCARALREEEQGA